MVAETTASPRRYVSEVKRRKMRIKDTDTFVDLSKEDKDALDTLTHYCKQHKGYERNEEGNI